MDARTFYRAHGLRHCQQVAERAGISWRSMRSYIYGQRRPSLQRAVQLVAASDGELTLSGLVGVDLPLSPPGG